MRRKKNSSGSYSVQIIPKVGWVHKGVKLIGSSFDSAQLDSFERQAKLENKKMQGQAFLFSNDRDANLKSVLSAERNNPFELIGPDRILGKVYKSIGF